MARDVASPMASVHSHRQSNGDSNVHRRRSRRGNCAGLLRVAMIAGLIVIGAPAVLAQTVASEEDAVIAQSLAEMLRDARAIVSNNQNRINDPEIGDKGLTADVVLNQAIETYKKNMGVDPTTIDPASRQGRLMRAMMAAIREVMDANQPAINAKGIGFKAFIPAVFGRLVGEAFARLAKGEAELKVTAPLELVRNRKARPDGFEESIIKTKLVDPAWPRGQAYTAMADAAGRPGYPVLVPGNFS